MRPSASPPLHLAYRFPSMLHLACGCSNFCAVQTSFHRTGVHLLFVSAQWFSPLIEDIQVSTVDEEAVSFATSGLFEDAEVDHVAQ
jgi:hypothetical protein